MSRPPSQARQGHRQQLLLPAWWQALVVGLVVAATSTSGHWVVTGRPPSVLAVLVASVLAASVLALAGGARRGDTRRDATLVVLTGQAGFHCLFTLSSGEGCLPVLSRAAAAGVDLALIGAGVDCFTPAGADGLSVALLAGLIALPLLAGHVLAGVLGVRGAGWVGGLVLAAIALWNALSELLAPSRFTPVPVDGMTSHGLDIAAPVPVTRAASRPAKRRGPPAYAPA